MEAVSQRPYRLAINGFGRIGRCVLRGLYECGWRDRLQVVAINEPADPRAILHLTRYDSTHGRFPGKVELSEQVLQVDGDRIQLLSKKSISQLPWRELAIDAVLECSGVYKHRSDAQSHLDVGAGKVLFSHPAESDVDATVVFGFNHQIITPQMRILSNSSCTTNASIPVIKALHEAFGVEQGMITTLHSAMNDQPVIDAYHHTDLRKTRSAMNSMIPIDTALAQGIDRLMPELSGRFDAVAIRVPTANVSALDITLTLTASVTAEKINDALKLAANNAFSGVLGYTEEMIVSCDVNHDLRSAVIDAGQTRVVGGTLVKVLVWFDNEWAFANRMLDTANVLRQC